MNVFLTSPRWELPKYTQAEEERQIIQPAGFAVPKMAPQSQAPMDDDEDVNRGA